jgi:predicted RNA binding protein YcfA (HicA-like mRNA interferase family)
LRRNSRVRDVIGAVQDAGWVQHHSTGGHRIFRHPTIAGPLPIPGGMGETLPRGTLNSILRQAGLRQSR